MLKKLHAENSETEVTTKLTLSEQELKHFQNVDRIMHAIENPLHNLDDSLGLVQNTQDPYSQSYLAVKKLSPSFSIDTHQHELKLVLNILKNEPDIYSNKDIIYGLHALSVIKSSAKDLAEVGAFTNNPFKTTFALCLDLLSADITCSNFRGLALSDADRDNFKISSDDLKKILGNGEQFFNDNDGTVNFMKLASSGVKFTDAARNYFQDLYATNKIEGLKEKFGDLVTKMDSLKRGESEHKGDGKLGHAIIGEEENKQLQDLKRDTQEILTEALGYKNTILKEIQALNSDLGSQNKKLEQQDKKLEQMDDTLQQLQLNEKERQLEFKRRELLTQKMQCVSEIGGIITKGFEMCNDYRTAQIASVLTNTTLKACELYEKAKNWSSLAAPGKASLTFGVINLGVSLASMFFSSSNNRGLNKAFNAISSQINQLARFIADFRLEQRLQFRWLQCFLSEHSYKVLNSLSTIHQEVTELNSITVHGLHSLSQDFLRLQRWIGQRFNALEERIWKKYELHPKLFLQEKYKIDIATHQKELKQIVYLILDKSFNPAYTNVQQDTAKVENYYQSVGCFIQNLANEYLAYRGRGESTKKRSFNPSFNLPNIYLFCQVIEQYLTKLQFTGIRDERINVLAEIKGRIEEVRAFLFQLRGDKGFYNHLIKNVACELKAFHEAIKVEEIKYIHKYIINPEIERATIEAKKVTNAKDIEFVQKYIDALKEYKEHILTSKVNFDEMLKTLPMPEKIIIFPKADQPFAFRQVPTCFNLNFYNGSDGADLFFLARFLGAGGMRFECENMRYNMHQYVEFERLKRERLLPHVAFPSGIQGGGDPKMSTPAEKVKGIFDFNEGRSKSKPNQKLILLLLDKQVIENKAIYNMKNEELATNWDLIKKVDPKEIPELKGCITSKIQKHRNKFLTQLNQDLIAKGTNMHLCAINLELALKKLYGYLHLGFNRMANQLPLFTSSQILNFKTYFANFSQNNDLLQSLKMLKHLSEIIHSYPAILKQLSQSSFHLSTSLQSTGNVLLDLTSIAVHEYENFLSSPNPKQEHTMNCAKFEHEPEFEPKSEPKHKPKSESKPETKPKYKPMHIHNVHSSKSNKSDTDTHNGSSSHHGRVKPQLHYAQIKRKISIPDSKERKAYLASKEYLDSIMQEIEEDLRNSNLKEVYENLFLLIGEVKCDHFTKRLKREEFILLNQQKPKLRTTTSTASTTSTTATTTITTKDNVPNKKILALDPKKPLHEYFLPTFSLVYQLMHAKQTKQAEQTEQTNQSDQSNQSKKIITGFKLKSAKH